MDGGQGCGGEDEGRQVQEEEEGRAYERRVLADEGDACGTWEGKGRDEVEGEGQKGRQKCTISIYII